MFCENGLFRRPGRKPIHDVHHYGTLDAAHVLIKSSNIGIAKISIASGPQMLYEYLKKFGIGDKTHIELPGETGGILWPLECGATNSEGRPLPCWSASSHEYIAFGHEVEATAVQLARAVAVIANGGLLVAPHVVLRKGRPRAAEPWKRCRRTCPRRCAWSRPRRRSRCGESWSAWCWKAQAGGRTCRATRSAARRARPRCSSPARAG